LSTAFTVFDGLTIDQHGQALVKAQAIAIGQALLLPQRLGNAGEAQAAPRLDRGMDHDRSLLSDGVDWHGGLSCSTPVPADCLLTPDAGRSATGRV
jgi:hypothetical protein